VIRAVEAALATLPGLRAAEPGEFTRRALMHGRIDLSEAEGLGDLLAAETETQRRAAIRSAEGAVRREVEGWAARALAVAARVEAILDHADEDDVAPDPQLSLATELAAEIEVVVERPPVERLRDGIRIVLAGPPNAGKSTLLNALAERDAAIVSPIAGTTRDRIEAPVVRDGVAYLLTDTAGLADATEDVIEAIGIARAHEALAEADLVLWLGDDAAPEGAIAVYARADIREGAPEGSIAVSAKTGQGIDTLWAAIAHASNALLPPPDLVALNQRQRSLCATAARALRAVAGEQDLLLAAEQLRSARRAFDAITGRADVEAMLDALFARFCIGK
jgi:tRNA modification GTPase